MEFSRFSGCVVVRELLGGLAITLLLIQLFSKLNGGKSRRRPGKHTLRLLTETKQVEKECKPFCDAFLSMPPVSEESVCAEQIREIVMGKHLLFKSLETNPEHLLRVSRHIVHNYHGALATRYTVQYNLYAGSVVALGSDEQRAFLYETQERGELGCFAFTELGAGVLSGAGVETTAVYDPVKKEFCIHSPCKSASKTWISQGVYAEHAVILANIIMPDGSDKGPHLFFTRIQHRDKITNSLTPVPGVSVSSLEAKIALQGLDNAYISFDQFVIPRESLLSRFSNIDEDTGEYSLTLPKGNKRMLDLLISRLLTGRVCLSEYTLSYAENLVKSSYSYASQRDLWISKRQRGTVKSNKMSEKPLIAATFTRYIETIAVIAAFIEDTREVTAEGIRNSSFPPSLIEAVCICKFVGTSFGVDTVSVMRKMMGSHAMFAHSKLGESSFVCNATCAAEGDNTVMELKVVGDLIKGGLSALFPFSLVMFALFHSWTTRYVLWNYVTSVVYAFWLGKRALEEGQLLRDIAWCRAHLLILKSFWARRGQGGARESFSGEEMEAMEASYSEVLVRFPVPSQF